MIDAGDVVEVNFGRSAIKEEAEACEYGSYEDHIGLMRCENCNGHGWFHDAMHTRCICKACKGEGKYEQRKEPYDTGLLHIVELLQRDPRKTRVSLYTSAEIEEFFGSLCTGTFGLYHLSVLQRIYKQLAPFVSEEVKARIPYGSLGY